MNQGERIDSEYTRETPEAHLESLLTGKDLRQQLGQLVNMYGKETLKLKPDQGRLDLFSRKMDEIGMSLKGSSETAEGLRYEYNRRAGDGVDRKTLAEGIGIEIDRVDGVADMTPQDITDQYNAAAIAYGEDAPVLDHLARTKTADGSDDATNNRLAGHSEVNEYDEKEALADWESEGGFIPRDGQEDVIVPRYGKKPGQIGGVKLPGRWRPSAEGEHEPLTPDEPKGVTSVAGGEDLTTEDLARWEGEGGAPEPAVDDDPSEPLTSGEPAAETNPGAGNVEHDTSSPLVEPEKVEIVDEPIAASPRTELPPAREPEVIDVVDAGETVPPHYEVVIPPTDTVDGVVADESAPTPEFEEEPRPGFVPKIEPSTSEPLTSRRTEPDYGALERKELARRRVKEIGSNPVVEPPVVEPPVGDQSGEDESISSDGEIAPSEAENAEPDKDAKPANLRGFGDEFLRRAGTLADLNRNPSTEPVVTREGVRRGVEAVQQGAEAVRGFVGRTLSHIPKLRQPLPRRGQQIVEEPSPFIASAGIEDPTAEELARWEDEGGALEPIASEPLTSRPAESETKDVKTDESKEAPVPPDVEAARERLDKFVDLIRRMPRTLNNEQVSAAVDAGKLLQKQLNEAELRHGIEPTFLEIPLRQPLSRRRQQVAKEPLPFVAGIEDPTAEELARWEDEGGALERSASHNEPNELPTSQDTESPAAPSAFLNGKDIGDGLDVAGWVSGDNSDPYIDGIRASRRNLNDALRETPRLGADVAFDTLPEDINARRT